jgi:hypothetical protein
VFPKTALFRTSYLLAICAATLLGVGCAKGGDLHKTIKSQTFQTPGNAPVMLAAYQAWFGHRSHINVGYSSQDRVVIQQQMERAKQLGIAGFVVNWYGPVKDFEDRAYAIMQEVASANKFQVALLYDESEATSGEATDTTIRDLQYAYDHYIGPNSQVANSSYLRYNGRPVIFIFPKGGKTDWNKVRHAVDQWQERPLLIYKDANPKYAQALDGFYAWVHPGKGGWQRNGSNWGRDYLDDFYVNMTSKYPDKIAVGAAWPGFDDSKASWSRNRKMDARCGKTLEDSLRVFRRYYDDSRPLPYLMIDTWNDYEEGTAIERGTVGCGNDRSASFDPAKRSGGGD